MTFYVSWNIYSKHPHHTFVGFMYHIQNKTLVIEKNINLLYIYTSVHTGATAPVYTHFLNRCDII